MVIEVYLLPKVSLGQYHHYTILGSFYPNVELFFMAYRPKLYKKQKKHQIPSP